MKNLRLLFLLTVVFSASWSICLSQETPIGPKTAPIWDAAALPKEEDLKIKSNVTLYQKPPFYRGNMPLAVTWLGRNHYRGFVKLQMRLDNFVNSFVYRHQDLNHIGAASGAITRDLSGKLIAEARFLDFSENEKQINGLKIEEIHYGRDGSPIFKCISVIDQYSGWKISSSNALGTKQKDYYFIWPVDFN